MFPKPLVAYCKEKYSWKFKKLNSNIPQLVMNDDKAEDAGTKGTIQIELQQVFIKNVVFSFKFNGWIMYFFISYF